MSEDIKRINPEEAAHYWEENDIAVQPMTYFSINPYMDKTYCGCLLGALAVHHGILNEDKNRTYISIWGNLPAGILRENLIANGYDEYYIEGLDHGFTNVISYHPTPLPFWDETEQDNYLKGVDDGHAVLKILGITWPAIEQAEQS